MRSKIETLYKEAKNNNISLLPTDTSYEWWDEYENNFSIYDRYFLDLFRDFYYWVNFSDNTTSEILSDFKDAVSSFLAINQKRFSELYRIHVLPNSAYDPVNNYSLTETHSATYTEGQRQDSASETEGQRSDSTNTTLGQRADSSSQTVGAKTDTSELEISAFNSTAYQDSDKTTNTLGAQQNSVSSTLGSQQNSSSLTKGAQQNSSSLIKGSQTNTESSTLTRAGNIGIQTPADVIGGHLDLWDRFNFYKQIFDEIAKNYFVCDNRYI